jgi:dihydrofolate synthase / folylpolyglutamate synthase
MRFREAVAELDARQPEGMVPDLDRISAVADLLDHPELRYPTVHVTGTNGKTSTVRLVTRILCAHGLTAGRFTSPHLASVTERLGVCDDDIDGEDFGDTYAHLLPVLEQVDARGQRVTYFEALTALAYLWFADKPVDVGIFEVGMGGEWDATNLIRSDVAVFCSIDLDHPELGETVERVAREKAGIIKEGSTVVVQDPNPATMEAVERRAAELGVAVLVLGQDFWIDGPLPAVGGQQFTVRTKQSEYRDLALPLYGPHQVLNAATAVAAGEALLGRALGEDPLRQALAGATSPGRLEVVSRHPLVVLDGAHNPQAARVLAGGLADAFTWRRLHVVIGVLDRKDLEGIVEPLALRAHVAYACTNSNPHSRPADEVAAACDRAGLPATAHASVEEALDAAEAAAGPDDLILVTGSLYTVADARPRYVPT